MKPHVPMRQCVCCGKRAPKQELLRIVKKDDVISYDADGKAQGRGAYLCRNPQCREQMTTRRRLNRAFRQNVAEKDYLRLEEEMG